MPNKITALLQAPLDSKCEARQCRQTDRHVFSPEAFFLHNPTPAPHPTQKPLHLTFRDFFTEVNFTICVVFGTYKF